MKKSILMMPIMIALLTGCADKPVNDVPAATVEISKEAGSADANAVEADSTGTRGYILVESKRANPESVSTAKVETQACEKEQPVVQTEETGIFEDVDPEVFTVEEPEEEHIEEAIYEEPETSEEIFTSDEPIFTDTADYSLEYENIVKDSIPGDYYDFLSFNIFNGDGVGKDLGYVSDAFTYYTAYMHYGQTSEAGIQQAYTSENDIINELYFNALPYDMRKDLTSYIAEQYGVCTCETVEETILKTHERINSKLTYDESYIFTNMGKCIEDGRGVCWTYAQIARALLNLEGIPAYVVTGTYQGVGHARTKAYVNGEWIQLDFTYGRTPFIEDIDKYTIIQDINVY